MNSYQSALITGGLVVASSNLVAPTNNNRDLADSVESLFLILCKMCSVCVVNENFNDLIKSRP